MLYRDIRTPLLPPCLGCGVGVRPILRDQHKCYPPDIEKHIAGLLRRLKDPEGRLTAFSRQRLEWQLGVAKLKLAEAAEAEGSILLVEGTAWAFCLGCETLIKKKNVKSHSCEPKPSPAPR
jgi:hypothetical protein